MAENPDPGAAQAAISLRGDLPPGQGPFPEQVMGAKYQEYLASREWALKREAVRARANGLCERCKKNPMDAVHHLTYANIYREPLEDLQAICEACHKFESGKSAYDPKEKIEKILIGPWSDFAPFEQISLKRAEMEWPEHFLAIRTFTNFIAFGLYSHPNIMLKIPYITKNRTPISFIIIPAIVNRSCFDTYDCLWLIDRPSVLKNAGFRPEDIDGLALVDA